MSLSEAQRRKLAEQLRLTQDKEFDCDEFLENLAAYLDKGLEKQEFRDLMKHHMQLCEECMEEYELLVRALSDNS